MVGPLEKGVGLEPLRYFQIDKNWENNIALGHPMASLATISKNTKKSDKSMDSRYDAEILLWYKPQG